MPRLTLERDGKVLDLDALLKGSREGAQALAGITGFGLPPVTVQWSEGAGDGATFRGQRVNARPIDLPITYTAGSRSALKALLRDLVFVLAGEATLRLTEDDGSSAWLRVRRTGGGDPVMGTDTNGREFLKIVVTVQAGDPFWTSSVTRSALYTDAAIPTSITFANDGTADAYPIWTITGPGQNWTAVSERGEVLNFAEFLPRGTTITIDTKRGTVVDQDGRNRYSGLGSAPRFFTIPPGSSTVTISYDRSSADFLEKTTTGRRNYFINPRLVDATGFSTFTAWKASGDGGLSVPATHNAALSSSGVASISGLTPGQTYVAEVDYRSSYDPGAETNYGYNGVSQDYLPFWGPKQVAYGALYVASMTGTTLAQKVLTDYAFDGRLSLTFVAPASDVALIVRAPSTSFTNSLASRTSINLHPARIDNVFVGEPGGAFYGDSPATADFTYSWTGTANASASKETPRKTDTSTTSVGFTYNPRDWMVI